MSKARITDKAGFKCAPEGHTVVTIPFGSIVEGEIAEWALAAHKASRMFDQRTDTQDAKPKLETKRKGKRK